MFKRTLLTLMHALAAAVLCAQMQEVQIGLFRDLDVKRVIVLFGKAGATVQVDGRKVGELAANDGLRIEAVNGGLSGKSLSTAFTATQRITLIPKNAAGGFRVRSLDHPIAERTYPGWLEARVVNGRMTLIDQARLEDYVAGVVMSEAGKDQHPEYYKLQAVSCRTYALANLTKHAADGFELCDGTHCQVFKGAATDPTILQAAKATHGMVVVDANIRLIHATFHSNCGGETLNAEDVWSKAEPYLRSTVDTFCTKAPHAAWRRVIGRNEWLGYLQRKFNVDTTDRRRVEVLTGYSPSCRDLYLCDIDPLIPLEQVRTDWKLNSAYFSIGTEQGNVVLTGRGFGHGVGLCQEGAMNMARSGASFTDILHHYYADVHLVDLSTLDFFRDGGE